MQNLDELRTQLSDEQRAILNTVWSHFYRSENEHDPWIRSGILYNRLGKGTNQSLVHGILQPLGGTVIYENPELGTGKRYVLAALGLLLTDAGPEIEYVLGRYLEHVKNQYIKSSSVAEQQRF